MISRKKYLYNAERDKELNVIGKRIAELRISRKMSQTELSRALAIYGVKVGNTAVNKWELGGSVPNSYQLLAISEVLGIEDIGEAFMSADSRSLNAEGMRKLRDYHDDLIASGRYKRPSSETVTYIDMPVSILPASAGTGAFLDEGSYETVSFPESVVPDGAEFGVRISGNSMEPVYKDGQIVWVQPCKALRNGEVGIFICDGEGYVKVYRTQAPGPDDKEAFTDSNGTLHLQPVLVSYNQSYAPKVISPNMKFEIIGRVLS